MSEITSGPPKGSRDRKLLKLCRPHCDPNPHIDRPQSERSQHVREEEVCRGAANPSAPPEEEAPEGERKSWPCFGAAEPPVGATDGLPIIEPFRIKSVDRIRRTTRQERKEELARCEGNLFKLPADAVLIDLLTDSGTGAMSSEQWAAMMLGDESYAGAKSFRKFERVIRELFGFEHVIPTHQGRAAEFLLFSAILQPGDVVPNNTHFDTTRANVEARGALALDLPCEELADATAKHSFKGNMNLADLQDLLWKVKSGAPLAVGKRVPMVMMTLTNNAGGGHPVSLKNLRAVRRLCEAAGVPLYIDACRFAENAWLISQREEEQRERTVLSIVADIFDLAEGCTMSAKKDGLANIGGFLALRDHGLAEQVRSEMVLTEGFSTYGGMSGRDMEAIAQGLLEVTAADYLSYRCASIRYVCERLERRGIPVDSPPGGHAIYLDAARFLPNVPVEQYPGQALVIELYHEGGIRACEIGSVMLGRVDPSTGVETPAARELVRLAIPRRTYTQTHMDYVIQVIDRVWRRREEIRGVRIKESPAVLRHFGAKFEPVLLAPSTQGC